jgi:peptidoglycan/LPS O-acetylase OafA/YrhL
MVQGGNLSFWIPFGIHGKGHYWFIPALLQCYLLAPLIYWGIIKKPIILVVILVSGFIVANIILLNNYTPVFTFINAKWAGMYFLHILFFSFGFLIQYIVNAERLKNQSRSILHSFLFWFFTFLIVIVMIIIKYNGPNNVLLKVAPLFLIALLCIYSLLFSIENNVFSFLGNISYSIYLFHVSFYILLNKVGGFQKNYGKELIWFIVILPIFIFVCNYLERFGNHLYRKLTLKSQPEGIH